MGVMKDWYKKRKDADKQGVPYAGDASKPEAAYSGQKAMEAGVRDALKGKSAQEGGEGLRLAYQTGRTMDKRTVDSIYELAKGVIDPSRIPVPASMQKDPVKAQQYQKSTVAGIVQMAEAALGGGYDQTVHAKGFKKLIADYFKA